MHFYCFAIEVGFYSNVVECLPVNSATWVDSRLGLVNFSLYDINKEAI